MIQQRVVLPSRRTSSGWRNGLTGVSARQSPALEEEQPHVPVHTRRKKDQQALIYVHEYLIRGSKEDRARLFLHWNDKKKMG